jgi:hypothetical protein
MVVQLRSRLDRHERSKVTMVRKVRRRNAAKYAQQNKLCRYCNAAYAGTEPQTKLKGGKASYDLDEGG